MSWSVVTDGRVLTVVVSRAAKHPDGGHKTSTVWLVSGTGKEYRTLGYVMWVKAGIYGAECWIAMYDGIDWTGKHHHEQIVGFATRRYAIEHMLKRLGYRRPVDAPEPDPRSPGIGLQPVPQEVSRTADKAPSSR